MKSGELSPVSVEAVSKKDLDSVKIFAKVNKDDVGLDFAGKADALLGVASNVMELAENSKLYRVKVPDGYTLKDLIHSTKDAEAVRALVKNSNGQLNGDVALMLNGVSAVQVASMGLAAAAVVVGQAYMTEINDSLHSIDSKLDTLIGMMDSAQMAKVKNAISIANTYVSLHDEYFSKPPEALQAARNQIESRYNDVGEVVDWLTEQLIAMEAKIEKAKSGEKEVNSLLEELRLYGDKFYLCLQALSAFAMTRMYYDGCIDERSALIEKQRIEAKSQQFLAKWQRVLGIMELKIGTLKGSPVALPQSNSGGNVFKRLASQTPREAARSQLLGMKVCMQLDLRGANSALRSNCEKCVVGINRIASANQSARTMLTDGNDFWIIQDSPGVTD